MPVLSNVVKLAERPTDGSLVRAARAGDRAAKTELFERYVNMAANAALRILGNDQELDDILQESFTTAYASLDRLKDPQAFCSWLRRIVVGTTIATLRRRSLLSRLGLLRPAAIHVEELLSDTAPPDVAAELHGIYGLLEELPTRERAVLVLHRVEQLTLAEVAEETGWSHSTVKRSLRRAEQLLGERMRSSPEGAI